MMNQTLITYATCEANVLLELEPLKDTRVKIIVWLVLVLLVWLYSEWLTKRVESDTK